MTPGVWTDLFHQCALVAYVEAARACGGWPASEDVRRRAYALYEAALREGSAEPTDVSVRRSSPPSGAPE